MLDTLALLSRLHGGGVEFVIIGGVASITYGGDVSTNDLDICAPLEGENPIKIIRALHDVHPRWRTRLDLPVIKPDDHNLRPGLKNMYLSTDLGKLDVLDEVPGVCSYPELLSRSVEVDFEGVRCRLIDIETLISAKRHAGRDKDLQAVRELDVIRRALEQDVRPDEPS